MKLSELIEELYTIPEYYHHSEVKLIVINEGEEDEQALDKVILNKSYYILNLISENT